MNICFFNKKEEFGAATTGGMGRAMSLLAKELRRRGHRVDFYFQRPSHHFHIPIVSVLLGLFLPSFSKYSAQVRFHKFLKEHKIDIAVGHGEYWLFRFPLNNLPCKQIILWHNIPFYSEKIYSDHISKKFKLNSRLAQKIVLCKPCRFLAWKQCNFLRSLIFSYAVHHSDKFVLLSDRFIPEFPLSKKFSHKVCAIPNIAPYEANSVSFDEKKKELLWVGRVEFSQKRPDLMLRIWQHIQDRFPDWSLRFVGDGDYLPELKKLSTFLNLKNVFFEGFQNPAPYYRSAPIFCMTSAYEGFGLVLVEAQAYGCVPIAFESFGAIHDIIDDGVNGVLVSPFDLDAYAEKLTELMLNPELRVRLGSAAKKSVSRFSPEKIGDEWEKLLLEVQAY